jgi:hypothetical protein
MFGTQQNMEATFGPAGGLDCTAGEVIPAYPMFIAWDKKQSVKKIRCHKKVASSLAGILLDIKDAYTDEEIKLYGFDLFGGCFNYRNKKGGSTLSVHAYGAAVDINPDKNQFKWDANDALFAKKECKKFIDIFYKYGWISLGRERNFDWMHFQAPSL